MTACYPIALHLPDQEMNTDSYINEAVDFGPISLCATDVCFPFRDLTQGTILHFLNHR